MEENNYYEDKQNRQFLDNATKKNKPMGKVRPEKPAKEETQKEKLNQTAKEVGTDVVAGVLGGGLGASIFGSYSFFAGLIVSGFGHYTKNKYLARLGLGMMSSSSMKAAQGVKQDPKASMLDNIQERVKAFGQELQRKLLLDKLLADKDKSEIKSENNMNGVLLQTEDIDAPPAHLFEAKDRLENIVPKQTVPNKTASEENKDIESSIDKFFYKDDKDDLTDMTGRLY